MVWRLFHWLASTDRVLRPVNSPEASEKAFPTCGRIDQVKQGGEDGDTLVSQTLGQSIERNNGQGAEEGAGKDDRGDRIVQQTIA